MIIIITCKTNEKAAHLFQPGGENHDIGTYEVALLGAYAAWDECCEAVPVHADIWTVEGSQVVWV